MLSLKLQYGTCFEQGVLWKTIVHKFSKPRTWHNINIQMYRTDKYSPHSSIIWRVWLNGRVFVYQLSGCGFESRSTSPDSSIFNFRFPEFHWLFQKTNNFPGFPENPYKPWTRYVQNETFFFFVTIISAFRLISWYSQNFRKTLFERNWFKIREFAELIFPISYFYRFTRNWFVRL